MSKLDRQMGVIFDLDGVLVDTGWAHKQSWYDLAEKEAFSMTDEFFYSTFGMQNYMIIPMLLARDAPLVEINRLSDWKEQRLVMLPDQNLAKCKKQNSQDTFLAN